jgi:hypothetical protein
MFSSTSFGVHRTSASDLGGEHVDSPVRDGRMPLVCVPRALAQKLAAFGTGHHAADAGSFGDAVGCARKRQVGTRLWLCLVPKLMEDISKPSVR